MVGELEGKSETREKSGGRGSKSENESKVSQRNSGFRDQTENFRSVQSLYPYAS